MLIYCAFFDLMLLAILHPVKTSSLHKRAIERNIFRPPTKACLNFCIYTNCNLGTCQLDENTCYASCICPERITGRWCDTKIEDTEGTTFTPLMSSRQQTRIQFDSRTPGHPNVNLDGTLGETRTNSLDYTNSSTKIDNDTVPENFESRERKFFECKTLCPYGKCVEINRDYTCMNLSSDCADDFKCMNGICSNSSSGNNEHINICLCEYGYSGTFCDEECNQDCGIHGTCIIVNKFDNTTGCVCDIGYTGHLCKTRVNNTLKTTEYVEINNETFPENFHSRSKQWIDCQKNCSVGGSCVDFNGTYICSYSSSVCAPGFVCEYGRCLKITTDDSISLKCLCEYGYIGTFCNKKCDMDCGLNGKCKITDHKNHTTQCICDSGFSGPLCTIKISPRKDDGDIFNHWYVVGACIGIAALLLSLLVLLPYCLWKKRRLFVMKIIHYFQNYEDDDGKAYDAFISYKSSKTDQDFVLKQLYPKLETEMGYKLCMHFRDFTPGDVIANNIIRAIEDSRRTIMVISQNYIESEWCRLEYQKAQHEMLKLKHKIIPIILDDISKVKHDKNLKAILNSVTYIEWPGESDSKKLEKFWKQLKLSMPKRQSCSSLEPVMSVISSSEKSFNGSSFTDSNSSSFSSHPSIQPSDSSVYTESKSSTNSNRIKTLLRNPFRLNITSDNFKKLSRAYSSDSGISSPITASPSSATPLINKEINPLIPRKHLDIRHNISKGLVSQNIGQVSVPGCQMGNQSIIVTENGVAINGEIPDVCKPANGKNAPVSLYNIIVPEPDQINTSQQLRRCNSSVCRTCILNEEISNELVKDSSHLESLRNRDCPTCVLHNDKTNQNEKEVGQPNILMDKILNTSKIFNTSDRTNTI